MNNIKNESTLILRHPHGLARKDLNLITSLVKKVIVLDGEYYDVIKTRHGKPTKNGHVSFLTKELEN